MVYSQLVIVVVSFRIYAVHDRTGIRFQCYSLRGMPGIISLIRNTPVVEITKFRITLHFIRVIVEEEACS